MRKKILLICSLFVLVLFSSCMSLTFAIFGPSQNFNKIRDPFVDYEGFGWGTDYDTINKRWPLEEGKGFVYIGYYFGKPYKPNYYKRGTREIYIDKTLLYFDNPRTRKYSHRGGQTDYYLSNENRHLYAVEDVYKKTPTMDFLHSRYGDFSEENLVTSQQISDGITTVYRGPCLLNSNDLYALEIRIDKKGVTTVRLQNPFFIKSRSEPDPKNRWICYSALTTKFSKIDYKSDKVIEYTFLNKNNEGKYLFIGYSKSYEKPSVSYVRAGVCWGDKTSGVYDISGNNNIVVSKKFSIDKWKCLYNNQEYAFTNMPQEGAREILDLFLSSQKISVRHNKTISQFLSDGEKLLDKMTEMGITLEEIDAALLNEEF